MMRKSKTAIESLISLPIVDILRHDADRHAYILTFLPEDNVSHAEKEMVEILETSSEGKRIQIQIDSLTRLFKSKKRIDRVIHSGGDEFEISFSGGRVEILSGEDCDTLTLQAAHRFLQDIAMTAQVFFILQRREGDVIVA